MLELNARLAKAAFVAAAMDVARANLRSRMEAEWCERHRVGFGGEKAVDVCYRRRVAQQYDGEPFQPGSWEDPLPPDACAPCKRNERRLKARVRLDRKRGGARAAQRRAFEALVSARGL